MRSTEHEIRREVLTRLARQPLFAGLDAKSLMDLADAMQWLALPGGARLFEQGDESDALYVLLLGRLAATRTREDGSIRWLGCIAPGESVGEAGLIAREPRAASVYAMRDSEVLRLPRADFDRLIALHPSAMLGMARIALRRTNARPGNATMPRCFALLPTLPGIDALDFAHRLAVALGADPLAAVITREEGHDRDPGWFGAREARSSHLVYVGDHDSAWNYLCQRQSDCVLLLGDGRRTPDPAWLPQAPEPNPHQAQFLLLAQTGDPLEGSTRAWRAAYPAAQSHHHLRDEKDLARLARHLHGRAIGLVLSGGGARGFAHIGVLRALRESGIAVDYVGGASIGAIIGAGIAADWSHEQLVEVYRQSFVDTNPLSDWTLPLVSLRAGSKVSCLLRRAFGERDIEDLPLPFFCVSSDLTEGVLEVHETGTLWPALRASSAIPGVLPPVLSAGRVLVDGGVIDNLPVAQMRKRLAGQIIAVDVGGNYRLETALEETQLPPWWQLLPEVFGQRRHPRLAQILLRAGMVNSAATAQSRRRQVRWLLKPTLEGVELLTWQQFQHAIDLGYQYTLRRLELSREALHADPPLIGP